MSIDDLKMAWERQKLHESNPPILEDDILWAIQPSLRSQAKVRRVAYNLSSFVFLLIFCQTC